MPRKLLPLLLVALWGCDVGEAPIDPATLDPDVVVFAASSGGGFLMSGEEEFFVGQRHGRWGLWIYGDGRAIELSQDTLATLGYRVYRQGTVPEGSLQALVDQAQGLDLSGTVDYAACNATDGGGEAIAVDLPGLSFVAGSYMGFEAPGCETSIEAQGMHPHAPADVVAFAKALFAVEPVDAAILEPDSLILAGYAVDEAASSWDFDCTMDDAVEWTVAGVELPLVNPNEAPWTLPLEGTAAAEARAFVRAHLSRPQHSSYGSACVTQTSYVCLQPWPENGPCTPDRVRLYRVYYDDVPDGEAAWPF